MTLMELFVPYEPKNSLEALSGDLEDFDFEPETEFSTLTEMINFKVLEKLRRRNFSRIFLGFSRGSLIKTLRLSYRLSYMVVWEPHK